MGERETPERPSEPRRLPPATGAWRPGNHPGRRRFATVAREHPLVLEGGGILRDITIAYETWGELDDSASNAVLVCHALTGDSHAAGPREAGHPTEGWWDPLIGPGRALDTDRYFVVCANVLGGCQGTTGPASPAPDTGRPFGSRFPQVTIRDMVRTQAALADHLGVRRWLCVVGGSMGGMQVLEWGIMFPRRVRSLAPIATCAASSALQIAYSSVQRQAIAMDPNWRGGDYYDAPPGEGPHRGLALARAIAQITYRTGKVFEDRFGRKVVEELDYTLWQRFDVEGYLDYHGLKLVRRFDANSYLLLSKAMDLHDVGRDRWGISRALRRIRVPTLVMGIESDTLYPLCQQELIRDELRAAGLEVWYSVIRSDNGHDAFLIDTDQVAAPLGDFIEAVSKQPWEA
ncbi:MAG: homoserine O-acetyltransferase [Acidimicrobiales bacterium]|nr:MAG: homoserine O-acetyltransferase [Acidimicrobiales bacterium]